jgi:hypothetical protein
VESRPHKDTGVKAFRLSPFQPSHGLILVVQAHLDHGNLGSIGEAGTRSTLRIAQDLYCFLSTARYGSWKCLSIKIGF